MRILPVFKLDQILRSSRSRDRGRSGFDDVAGAFLRSFWSVNYRKKLPDSNGRAYSLVSDAYAGCAQAQAWVTFSVSRRKIFGTVAGTNPSQVMRQEGSWSMFQAWKLWRSNILYRGSRESSYRECHPSIYWRPAIFVSLADRKGQVYLVTTYFAGCNFHISRIIFFSVVFVCYVMVSALYLSWHVQFLTRFILKIDYLGSSPL